jgi:hypothetical protein
MGNLVPASQQISRKRCWVGISRLEWLAGVCMATYPLITRSFEVSTWSPQCQRYGALAHVRADNNTAFRWQLKYQTLRIACFSPI